MASRVALVVTLIFLTVMGMSVLSNLGLAGAAQTYRWEVCDEGWAADDSGVGLGDWSRGEPGHESDTSFQTGQYSEMQDPTVTSLPYTWEGGAITVEYFIAHDVEPEGATSVFDFAAFEWSVDEGEWTMEAQYAGQNEGYPAFVADSVTFEPPAGELQIRFRLHSDELFSSVTEGYEGVFVDNVMVPLPKPEGSECEGADPSPSASGTPSPSPSPTNGGGGSDCTITGTRYGDHIDGTEGDDVICGFGGNDVLDGLGGDDVIRGASGDDILVGGEGADVLRGARGEDTLQGEAGDDTLRGGKNPDDLNGGSGNDDCKGGKGKDKSQGCE